MIIEVGQRKLESLTSEEFGQFLYDRGYSFSKEFWHLPIFSEFEYFQPTNSIHFKFTQISKLDKGVREKMGIISDFENDAKFSYITAGLSHKIEMHYFNISDVRYFLKLNFDLKIY